MASNKLLNLTKEIIAQDLHAIGRIALEIYNSNSNIKPLHQSPIRSKIHANCETLRAMLNKNTYNEHIRAQINNTGDNDNVDVNDLQKDFIKKCLSVNKSNPISIDSIWNHPFINIIYSLRVLSVFSVFTYFQEQAKAQAKQAKQTPSLSKISEEKSNNENVIDPNASQQASNSRPRSNQSLKLNSSYSSLDKFKEKRKVSLTFLSSFTNLTLPQNFFAILDDIRYGLYPRIFKVYLYRYVYSYFYIIFE